LIRKWVSAVSLDYRTIKRAYAILSPVYDLIFDKVFYPGRVAAIDLLEIRPGDRILEVGVGTGLNLPLYPRECDITGIDISEEMLKKAEDRVVKLGMPRAKVLVMDGSKLDFPDNSFDKVIATYVISAVPDPVTTLLEMRRVCKPSGHLVILNHFKSDNPVIGMFEKLLAPVCTKIGFNTELKLAPLLERVALSAEQLHRVNLLNGWRLVRCINP
jgi:phosphatidylethanolamine/phosphatidyl-N-methylethanolamine N-methyltransferase